MARTPSNTMPILIKSPVLINPHKYFVRFSNNYRVATDAGDEFAQNLLTCANCNRKRLSQVQLNGLIKITCEDFLYITIF